MLSCLLDDLIYSDHERHVSRHIIITSEAGGAACFTTNYPRTMIPVHDLDTPGTKSDDNRNQFLLNNLFLRFLWDCCS